MNDTGHRNALPSGYQLFWYRIDRVLGQGAFGITYLAHDVNLDRQVALKEYIPAQLSMRESSFSVHPLSAEHDPDFRAGLDRFISEARTLTRFEHPNLIRVFNVFEANNTAYMVMNYELGQSLQVILKRKQPMSEEQLVSILQPLMSGLHIMHMKGFIHRDVKPGNIFIRTDGAPVLLDFGSARQTLPNNPQTLTNFVSPGYAPIEQYASKSDKQGPWTDIYGLGATMYRVITGIAPMNAIDRSEAITHDGYDCYLPLTIQAEGKYSEKLLAALDHALAFRSQDRPQNIEEWWEELGFSTEEIKVSTTRIETEVTPTVKVDEATTRPLSTMDMTVAKTLQVASESTTVEKLPENYPQTEKTSTLSWHGHRNILIAGSALIVLLLLLFVPGLPEKGSIETPPLPDTRHETQAPDISIVETPTQSVEQIMDTAGDDEVVQELLLSAEQNMKDLKLTTPAGDNAYEKFLQVLELDPQNEAARKGIQSVSDKYISLSYGAMNSGDTELAGMYIGKAGETWPESPAISQAKQDLQARVDQNSAGTTTDVAGTGEKSSGVMSDIKKWFRETAEKESEVKKEETASDKVIKSMGGR